MICMAGCAGSSRYMTPTQSFLRPSGEKALVRFMRPSGFGYAINFNILDGKKEIGNSVAKSQFDYLAEPGTHLFIATAENKSFLEAELDPGKIYYILTRVGMGGWSARVYFEPVTKGSEFWDKVIEYENTLNKVQPDKEALKKWEVANMDKIEKVITDYETIWKDKKEWPKLNREDGR